ncbi:dihydrolipoamide acetyltransferase family protein [Amycolatopsis sp. YIM 10]|uniref:dihydrolipoamide acetyltransferase family protein n=1 Tax=Amycolatopsis sp. YIM 10 TaxID=2653857 RepID=UPI001290586B|nr:dihydrolipoamide acetyltransferase family protein [Amycolatopsis sp. YIM 10]QFU94574.1 Dihydrolipoyllysine-residue acetyltransferase component of pyruvate dehydrogenase complex [Amycolatopsis sp. YIM 10]
MPQYKQFPLADTAEGLTEADILNWHVKPGDEVKVNQIVVEIETAKAAVELPIPWAGVITELHVEPGQTVEVGTPILTIDTDPGGAPAEAPSPNGAAAAPTAAPAAPAEEEMKPLVGYGSKTVTAKRRARKESAPVAAVETPAPAPAKGGYVPLAKPPVRKLAKDLGVDLHSLAAEGQVITREDVQRAASGAADEPPVKPAASSVDTAGERRVPIKGVRKATAKAMVESAYTAPHVTEFLTVDVTPMMELREKLKKSPAFAGIKLTPLAFAAKAMCLAAKRTPDVNASWDEENQEIVYKSYVHLGIAAATPRGLIVPKIRNAEQLSLPELAQALSDLTDVAREGKTAPGDMVNGSITITNVGVFGVDTGTPIITPGESAILAFGAIRDTPWVVDGEIKVRKVLQLALSFDHRVVDGQQGSQFLADVGMLLSDPASAFIL